MITGHFGADFTAFNTAVEQAEVKLRGFETDATTVEKRLNALGNAYSGQKTIQEATLLTKAIQDLGGATKLTASEQVKVNATLTEAIEKYSVLGQQAPQAMRDLAAATAQSDEAMGKYVVSMGDGATGTRGFADQLGESDRILGAFGVHMGPIVGAMREFGDASGKTVSQLGLLGTAGLVVGAAVGGWKIGEWIDGMTGWSTSIANATAALLGYGDVGAEEAAAKTDQLARASRIAGEAITELAAAAGIIATDNLNKEIAALERSRLAKVDIAAQREKDQRQIAEWRRQEEEEAQAAEKREKEAAAAEQARIAGMMAWRKDAQEAAFAAEQAREAGMLAWRKQAQEESAAAIESATQRELDAEKRLEAQWGVQMPTALDRYVAKIKELDAAKVAGVADTAQRQEAENAFGKALLDEALALDAAQLSLNKHADATVNATQQTNSLHQAIIALAPGVYEQESYFDQATAAIDRYHHALYAGDISAAPPNIIVPGGPQLPAPGYGGPRPTGSGIFFPNPNQTYSGGFGGAGAGVVQNINVTQPLGTPNQIARAVGSSFNARMSSQGYRAPES